jgi:hypothetical protein
MKASRILSPLRGLLIGVIIAGSAYAQGPAPRSTAQGILEVGGKKIPLSYAYAVPERNNETLIILSDQSLNDKELKDVFERIHRVEADSLHTVEVTIDAKKVPMTVSVRHKALMPRGGGFSSEDTYVSRKSDKGTVAGRFYRKSPGEFEGVAFTYDVTFSAPIWREPPPTYSGEAAKNSPQAKAAIAFFKAGRAGDLEGLKKVVVASSIPDLEGPMGKEILEMMKFSPDPAKAKITRVDVQGESAEVTFQEVTKESTETNTVRLKMEEGKWKVSPR